MGEDLGRVGLALVGGGATGVISLFGDALHTKHHSTRCMRPKGVRGEQKQHCTTCSHLM